MDARWKPPPEDGAPCAAGRFVEPVFLAPFLKKRTDDLRGAITADHSTWSKEGTQIDDPLPVLLHGYGIKPDSVEEFFEHQVLNGDLGRFRMYQIWNKFI